MSWLPLIYLATGILFAFVLTRDMETGSKWGIVLAVIAWPIVLPVVVLSVLSRRGY